MPVDFIIGAAIGAAVASKHVRKAVRRGLVYSVGGVLAAYDKLAAGAHAVAQSAREATVAAKDGVADPASGSPATAPDVSPPRHPVDASPGAGTSS